VGPPRQDVRSRRRTPCSRRARPSTPSTTSS
jgi:hypothetical protein